MTKAIKSMAMLAIAGLAVLCSCNQEQATEVTLQVKTQHGILEGFEQDGVKKFLGVPFAQPLLVAMMNSNGDNFDYYLHINPIYYLLSGAFALVVTLAVGYLFNKKIRGLDMVETLKGTE